VGARGHGLGGLVGGCPLILPLVYEELPVDPQAYAIVGGRGEFVVRAIEVEVSDPAGREGIGVDARSWGTGAPVVVDDALAAGENGLGVEGPQLVAVVREECTLSACGRGRRVMVSTSTLLCAA
jgi:hypothetical protein